MTVWYKATSSRSGANLRYLALANALEDAIASGRLLPGEHLPSHRQIAGAIHASPGTVTRAYGEARRRGLVTGEVGRGMFVRHRPLSGAGFGRLRTDGAVMIDLGSNIPVVLAEAEGHAWSSALAALRRRSGLAETLGSDWVHIAPRHRRAGRAWIGRIGLEASEDRIEVVHGAQAALCVVLAAVVKPGDRVLSTCLTHPGVKALAEHFSFKLRGVGMDAGGIRPAALEAACRKYSPIALYLEPTAHSPTTATLSPARRQEIATILRKYGVFLIEDESSAFLLQEPIPPLTCSLPELGFVLADSSRALSLGIRTTFVYSPSDWTARIAAAISATQWMAVPLPVEVATLWMSNGTAERLLGERRAELARRREAAHHILTQAPCRSTPHAHHVWIEMPAGRRSSDVVEAARRAGVDVEGSDWFAIAGHPVPEGIRVALGAEVDFERLCEGLRRLDACLP